MGGWHYYTLTNPAPEIKSTNKRTRGGHKSCWEINDLCYNPKTMFKKRFFMAGNHHDTNLSGDGRRVDRLCVPG
jgi:hypothetical protein